MSRARRLWLAALAGLTTLAATQPGSPPPDGKLTARHFRMSSTVMEPTVRRGETFLARTGNFGPIERGGVYVVRKRGVEYVVRVIGLPGDEFQFLGGGVFLKDGAASYSSAGTSDAAGQCARGPALIRREHLPGGASHLVMACDNSFGINHPPTLIPAGHFFLMGDNRSNAADSRYMAGDIGLGLVKESDFVARAERIFLSSDPRRIGKEID